MPKQSIIWTVLPNGITRDGKSLRFSLLVSPRLEPETQPPTLKAFSDFVSWPKTLKGTTFTLHVGSNSSIVPLDATTVDASVGTADQATWAALFPDSTSVLAQQLPDRSKNTVVSYDTVAMHKTIADLYEKLTVASNIGLPSVGQMVSDLGPLITTVGAIDSTYSDKKTHIRDVGRMFSDFKDGKLSKYDNSGPPLAAFQMFHTPPNAVTTKTFAPEDDPRLKVTYQHHVSSPPNLTKAVSGIDFHQIVAAMNQYPTLLRKLGLVLDFVVPRTSMPASADFTMWVTVKLPTVPAESDANKRVQRRSASPVTHTRHADTVLTTVSRPSGDKEDLVVSGGLLKLSDRFALLQMDVDGAGHKVINFARTLGRHSVADRHLDAITKLPKRAGAPALRNAGLMLVHSKRGKALGNAFARNKVLDDNIKRMFDGLAPASSQLYAEDVVRGWRIDIWDKSSGKWRSLCERIADYDINKGAIVLKGLREEGTIRLAATSSTDGANPGVVFLHEALTVWNGWSLVAQQPGKAIDRDDTKLRDGASEIPDGIRLKTVFVPSPGSLPRLRYGHVYAVRVRAVDLAGNSLNPKASNYPGDDTAITAATPYYRFEPIQPPNFALVGTKIGAQVPLAGESMARSVVRSFNDQFDDATFSAQEAQRWAVAARISQREAELHGVLDGAEWGTPQQYAMLAARDQELAQFSIVPGTAGPITGPIAALPGKLNTPVQKTPVSSRDEPDDTVKPGTTSFAVLPAGSELLPFLPDPLCTRIVALLFHHPLISPLEPIFIPLYRKGKEWPDVSPVLVRVYEATGEVPRFDERTHTLLIPTPKATRATLRISSTIDDETLKVMGVWNWVKQAARDDMLTKRARNGQVWSLTPVREMEIVHAVQRPLLKPDIIEILVGRVPGATAVTPTVTAMCHRDSTIKVDLHAVWHDPRDIGILPPSDQPKEAVPLSIKITDPQGYNGILEHALPEGGPKDSIQFGHYKLKAGDHSTVIEPKVHDFGDTRYRRVEYSLVGTTRFREYMPNDVLYVGAGAFRTQTDKNLKLEGASKVAWVMSSAPPPAPEVLYVVPTFGWTRGVADDGKTTSWRRGGGLRVWLDRPWNATGYGEMLAVVIPPKTFTADPNKPPYKHTVTQWGNDPIWKSSYVQGVAPVEANFPLRRMAPDPTGAWLPPGALSAEADQPHDNFSTRGLTHPGVPQFAPTGRVDVVPHDVFWDAERGLWYCDIEITHGSSYFPFVRLAVARYQPSSLLENHLSNVVLADFCALAPNRWLTVSNTNPTRRSVTVFGPAPESSSGYAEAFSFHTTTYDEEKATVRLPVDIAKSTVIEVWVEQLTAAHGEDFGWRKISTGIESLWQQASTPGASAAKAATRPLAAKSAAKPLAGKTPAQPASNRGMTAQQKARAEGLMQNHDFQAVLKESLIEAAYELPTLWYGSVQLPSEPSATDRYRIVVAEYEEYLADGVDPYAVRPTAMSRRLVFVEHVNLL